MSTIGQDFYAREGVATRRRLPRLFATLVLGASLMVPGAGVAGAQEEATEEPTPAASEEPAEETSSGPKITIHGHLSQAYADSDGGQFLGIPEEGTADYRTAALQIRADVSEDSTFALQFSHERLGLSSLQNFHDDVELDWLFYEHRFGASAVKVGRVQIPFGIYNEVRDVGTLLPFYRPSFNFYGESTFASETVDGIVLSHRFELPGSWELDGDVHYGNWDYVVGVLNNYASRKVRNSLGAELWLETPLPGLRIGAGWIGFESPSPLSTNLNRIVDFEFYHVSAEGRFGRVAADVEWKHVETTGIEQEAGYARLGVGLTERLALNVQWDFADLIFGAPAPGEVDFDEDKVVGLNFAFRPDLVLKTEHHWDEGVAREAPVLVFRGPAQDTRYWIVSLSTSF